MPDNRPALNWRSPYPWLAAFAAVLFGGYVLLLKNVRRAAREIILYHIPGQTAVPLR